MRRPKPRFDEVRNAWVTRAGGSLKILAKGPNDAGSEAAAWDAFYAHMARLGNPRLIGSCPCERWSLPPDLVPLLKTSLVCDSVPDREERFLAATPTSDQPTMTPMGRARIGSSARNRRRSSAIASADS